jgi:MYXO-CTERM domain-containing protein
MEEVSTKAKLVDSTSEPAITITVPRSEVEEALQSGDGEADLLLDVVRSSNGHLEQRRVAVEWNRSDLERLARESSGERVTLMIDPGTLEQAFDADVEAHGLRQAAVALSIVVATAGAGVAGAKGAVDQFAGSAGGGADQYAAIESVRAGTSSPDPFAAIEGVRADPSTPDASAAIENVRAQRSPSEPVPDANAGIENVRAERTAPEAAPDAYAGIENVRSGAPAVPDASAAIENVRANQTLGDEGSGGEGISAPSPGQAAGIAGAAALTIAGAAFALRRRRRPGIA